MEIDTDKVKLSVRCCLELLVANSIAAGKNFLDKVSTNNGVKPTYSEYEFDFKRLYQQYEVLSECCIIKDTDSNLKNKITRLNLIKGQVDKVLGEAHYE